MLSACSICEVILNILLLLFTIKFKMLINYAFLSLHCSFFFLKSSNTHGLHRHIYVVDTGLRWVYRDIHIFIYIDKSKYSGVCSSCIFRKILDITISSYL